jgi:small multidrug resistance pump
MSIGWVFLSATIVADAVATTFSRLSHGLTRPLYAVATLVAYTAVLVLFSQAIKTLPAGTAYAIWSGLGTVAIVAIGAVAFHDPLTKTSIVAVAFIVCGVVLLNLNGARANA